MKDNNSRDGLVLNLALYVVAIVLLLIAVFTQGVLERKVQENAIPPATVLEFLDQFIPAHNYYHQQEILNNYFSCVETGEIDHDGRTQTLRDINAVFAHERGQATTYFICSSKQNYLEIMLVDAEGNQLPPRIGVYYRVTGEGRISSFNFCRLQPVSRNSAEWDGEWQ